MSLEELYSLNIVGIGMNNIYIISGCQRSGTTLLSLMLSMHEEVVMVDETEFEVNNWSIYQRDKAYGPNLVLKLPAESHRLHKLIEDHKVKVLWMERQPLDVIYSMTQLMLPYKLGKKESYQLLTNWKAVLSIFPPVIEYSWTLHPYGGLHEWHMLSHLDILREKAADLIHLINDETAVKDEVFLAGAIYLLKKKYHAYLKEDFQGSLYTISYENLLSQPKDVIQGVLNFMGLKFSKMTLEHHKHLKGISIGNTINDEPIKPGNYGKYIKQWSNEKISSLESFLSTYG